MTEFTGDGLLVTPHDLNSVTPAQSDDDRMYHHDGSSKISLVGGATDSERGLYTWDDDAKAWHPLFRNADKIDGKEAGEFILKDGSIAMESDLNLSNYGLINLGELSGGTGGLHLNSNHVEIHSHSAGSNIRFTDNNGLLIAEGIEGGNFDIPNGQLSEQGSRVATRSWTNANANVPNADYSDNAGALGGNTPSSYVSVSGDQMEGPLDLGGFDLNDGGTTKYDSSTGEFVQSALAGPASSLGSYPLAASDLAEDYVLTSRLPLPASDLAEDYAVTSRFPIPNSDVANSSVTVNAGTQLSGGGTMSLGGSVTVNVVENNLDADTVDGNHASTFANSGHTHDSQYVMESGDTMNGKLSINSGGLDVEGSTHHGYAGIRAGSNANNGHLMLDSNGGNLYLNWEDGGEVRVGNGGGIFKYNGDEVATQTWVNSNSTGYTDSDARNAVDGSSLNSLTLSRTGLNSSSSWLEINGGSDGILIGYNQNANDVRSYQDVNLHGGSDFNARGGDLNTGNGNVNMGSGSATTSNFEVTENSSTNSLDFNYTG